MTDSDEDEYWTAVPVDDERWNDERWNDETWIDERWIADLGKEPGPKEPGPNEPARHSAGSRFLRPATVLTALAGVIALALAAAAVFGWLPSHSIAATPGLAPAGTGRIDGAGSARPGRPAGAARPSHRPAAQPAPPRRPTPSTTPVPSTRLEAVPGPVEFSLAPYFNNIGIVSAVNQDAGNIDGGGFAFSEAALAAVGARAGARVTYHGVPFTWPDTVAGAPDNVVASGQTLRIRGAGRTLAFLLTAGWGPATGTGKVVYANGSTQKFTITALDWWLDCAKTAPGDVLFTPYRYPGDGQPDSFTGCVYAVSVPLHAGQPVADIVLPRVSGPVPPGEQPSLHIFAVTIH
jgi:hypothetical protein